MKKIKFLSSLMFATLAFAGFTSCSDDNGSNPVADKPGSAFTVNTPAASQQYIQLSEKNTVNLTWSASDYGFGASVTYKAQLGYPQPDGTVKWNKSLKAPFGDAYLETTYNTCSADLNGQELAWAINNMKGYTKQSQTEGYNYDFERIAVRLHACITDGQGSEVANTGVDSDPVYFEHMKAYAAVKEPGNLYLIGNVLGDWIEPIKDNEEELAYWILKETEAASKIYEGEFTLPSAPMFRFYTKLTGWDGGDSYGADKGNKNVNIELTADDPYEGSIYAGGTGNYNIPNFTGGKVKLTVNLNTNMVMFAVVEDE